MHAVRRVTCTGHRATRRPASARHRNTVLGLQVYVCGTLNLSRQQGRHAGARNKSLCSCFLGCVFFLFKKKFESWLRFLFPRFPFFFLNSKTVRNYSPMYFYHTSFSLVLSCLVLSCLVLSYVLSCLVWRLVFTSLLLRRRSYLFIYLFIEGLSPSQPHRVITSGLFTRSSLAQVEYNTKHAHYINEHIQT